MVRNATCFLAALLCLACNGEEDKDPVTIGLSASLSGFDQEFGEAAEMVVRLAVDLINERGGIDGSELVLRIEDDESDADAAVAAANALIDAGAVAIVGPFMSFQAEPVVAITDPAEVVVVSPSATASSLISATANGSYFFRTTPHDDTQGVAMSYYLRQLAADLGAEVADEVAIVYEESVYGSGLKTTFVQAFQADDGAVVQLQQDGAPVDAYSYPPDLGNADPSVLDDLWAALVAANPAMIVVIGQGADANEIVDRWVASGQLPAVEWFFSDGVKNEGFLAQLQASGAMLRGTAPTHLTTGNAFEYFIDEMWEAHETDMTDSAYMSNTWDAVFLIAAALYQQTVDGMAFGGSELRHALTNVSRPEGVILHAGQWIDLTRSLENGSEVDYDGASGPCNLDGDGETTGPYEIWEVQMTGAPAYRQVTFIDAQVLEDYGDSLGM